MCIRCGDVAYHWEEELDKFKDRIVDDVLDLVDGWINPAKTNEDVEQALENLCSALEIKAPRELLNREAPKIVEQYDNYILEEYKRILNKYVKSVQDYQTQPMDRTYA